MTTTIQLVPINSGSLATIAEIELLERINASYSAAQEHYKKSVGNAIMVGVLLSHAKDTCAHGNFKEWIKEKLPFISYETANRYRKLAEAIRNSEMARATFDIEKLLQLPYLPNEEQEEVLGKIEKITEGKSLRQLYFDFAAVNKSDPRGGATVTGKKPRAAQPTLEELTAAAKQEWTMIVAKVESAHQLAHYTLLPEVQRQAILDTLYQVTNAIEEINPNQ